MSENLTWFKSSATPTSCSVSNIFASSETGAVCGINLREELSKILHGTGVCPDNQKGHWIKLRHYDKSTKSSYWNNQTKEGVDGPAWEFTDTFVKTRRVPKGKSTSSLEPLKAGIDLDDGYIYYFEYDVPIAKGDHFWELDYTFDHTSTPTNSVALEDRFIIKKTHPYRLEQGRIEYWVVFVEEDIIRY